MYMLLQRILCEYQEQEVSCRDWVDKTVVGYLNF